MDKNGRSENEGKTLKTEDAKCVNGQLKHILKKYCNDQNNLFCENSYHVDRGYLEEDRRKFEQLYRRCQEILFQNTRTYIKHFPIFQKVKMRLDTIKPIFEYMPQKEEVKDKECPSPSLNSRKFKVSHQVQDYPFPLTRAFMLE